MDKFDYSTKITANFHIIVKNYLRSIGFLGDVQTRFLAITKESPVEGIISLFLFFKMQEV